MGNSGFAWQAATLVECVAAAQRGDQHAFTELFERHRRFAWSIARSLTRTHEAAEEATIDGFAAAFRSIARLRQADRFPSYLASCVRNEALQAARRRGPTTVGTLDELDRLGEPDAGSETPEGHLVRSEDARRALAALERLEDRQREAVLLVDVEGMQPAEVAANLGLTVNALHQLLHRARESLRLRYVTPAISDSAPPACRTCTDKLGLYLAGRASIRVVSMVDLHTANCTECESRLAEAREVNDTVRAAYGAAPVGLLALLVMRHGIGVAASRSGPPSGGASGPRAHRLGRRGDGGRRGARNTRRGRKGPGGQGGTGDRLPIRAGLELTQRLAQSAGHLLQVGPLSAVPMGAVIAVASASITTVAAMAASLPLSLLPGAQATPAAVRGPAGQAAPITATADSGLQSLFASSSNGSPVPGSTAPIEPRPPSSAPDAKAPGPTIGATPLTPATATPLTSATATPLIPAASSPLPAATATPFPASTSTPGTAGNANPPAPAGDTSSTGGATLPPPSAPQLPTFTSAATTSFLVGSYGTFSVHVSGTPTPALTVSGTLPQGLSFSDEHNGTADLAGTPATGDAGTYALSLTASAAGHVSTQGFTLTVNQAPAFTTPGTASFYPGEAGSFAVHATGSPVPTLAESGALPPGLTFVDQGDGTATISGTPGLRTAGNYPITVSAANGEGPAATLALVIDVTPPAPVQITSSPFDFCLVGRPCQFTVSASGVPTPTLSITGDLPAGLIFVDNHNGTATISGTPTAPWTQGDPLTLTASSAGRSVTQQLHILVFGGTDSDPH